MRRGGSRAALTIRGPAQPSFPYRRKNILSLTFFIFLSFTVLNFSPCPRSKNSKRCMQTLLGRTGL